MCIGIGVALTSEGISLLMQNGMGREFVSVFDKHEGEVMPLVGEFAGMNGIFYHFSGSRQVSPGVHYIYVYGSNGEIILPQGVYYVGIENSELDIIIENRTFVMLCCDKCSIVEIRSTGEGNKISLCGENDVFVNMDYDKNKIL